MENLKKKDVVFNVYKVEEKFSVPSYYMVHTEKRNLVKTQIVEKVNFDVDTRGGLKIVKLNSKENLSLPEDAVLVLIGLKDNEFVPVKVQWDMVYSEGDNLILYNEDGLFSILENKFLKHKAKYVLWDGVVEKVTYLKDTERMNRDYDTIGINHLYSIQKDSL